jgi:peptide/nickel transport system substrate-binding protein
MAMTALSAAAADSASPTPVAQPKVLRIGMTTTIDNPTLFAVNSAAEWGSAVIQNDMALKFGPDLTAAPGLATGCDPSADKRTWTCHLRDGLKWSDGQPITSKDVVFSYNFVRDKQFDYFNSYFPEGTTFTTPDEKTYVWHLKDPGIGPMRPAWCYIVPEHIWGKYANATQDQIKAVKLIPNVASGPFVMTQSNPGQNWTFSRNPYFWGTKPVYDQVVFQTYTNQEAMVQALKNGEIDIADGFDGPLLPALGAIKNVAVQKVVSDFWVSLAFNFGGQGPNSHPLPALKDLNVRKAIEMAIDKQGIVDKVYPGAAAPGETIVRPLSTYWHLTVPADKVITYDPAAANALLDSSGYAKGPDGIRVDPKTGQPLHITLPTSDDVNGSTDVGQLVRGYLKQIGISVDVKPTTAAKMYDLQQSGEFDAYIWYWSGDPDPNYQLSVFTSSACDGDGHLSDGCWKDPAYDALFAKQQSEFDQTARQQDVYAAQQYVYDQIPDIVLAYPNYIEAYRTDKVAGLIATPAKVGYLTTSYDYASMVSAHPVDASASTGDSSSSGGIPVWVWPLALVVVGGGAFALVRRSSKGSDEFERD